jgi:aminoglycoside/choline kinase family phosphotransferase
MLTAPSLTQALGEHLDGIAVTAVGISPVGTGQMSDSYRLTLQYDDTAGLPSTLIAKIPAGDPTSRGAASAMGHYRTEVAFYREIAPTLAARTPRCFHASFDETTGDFLLLLEDLAPATQGDQVTGCSAEAAALAINELAKIHAPHWGDSSLLIPTWLKPGLIDDAALPSIAGLFPAFRDRYGERVDTDVLDVAELLFHRLSAYTNSSGEAQTLCQGDYRLDNLLFGTDAGGPPVAVVDWQTLSRGSGLQDLAYFIGGSFTPEERRRHEHALVSRYRSAMRSAGVELTDDYFWMHYRRHTFAGLGMAVAGSMLVEQTTRGDDMFVTMAQRHGRHALDLDAQELLC